MALYEQYGSADYIGEPVSQLEHMSQSAQMAAAEGYDEEVILVAFFHDIGHICPAVAPLEKMDGYGVMSHEKVGADYLREKGFSERLTQLVESHVQAKRYLTFAHRAYFDKLSEASKRTLAFQGGRMTAEEANAFENHDLFRLSIRMREWDEKAKEEHQPVADLREIREMCVRHLQAVTQD